MEKVLEVKNLEKSYKDVKAVKGIDFAVKKNEVLCFLGPNGAGKSTTINILAGVLEADAGEILYQGKLLKEMEKSYKHEIGIVPQELAIYENVSALKNVMFYASLYGYRGRELKDLAEKALKDVSLYDVRHRKPKTYSGGMKRRLNIACGVAHRPSLIIFDEPTVGIDPQSRNYILESIKALKEDDITVIYTSHYMEEVEAISTRIVIIDHGEIIATGTKESLKATLGDTDRFTIETENGDGIDPEPFYAIDGVKDVAAAEGKIHCEVLSGIDSLDEIVGELIRQNIRFSNLTKEKATLERVFLNLTGHSLRG